jgi:hypothetical protein
MGGVTIMRIIIVVVVWLSALTAYADGDITSVRDTVLLTNPILETRGFADDTQLGTSFAWSFCGISCPAAENGFIDGAPMSLDVRDPDQLNILFSDLIGVLVVGTPPGAARAIQSALQGDAVKSVGGANILEAATVVPSSLIDATWLVLIAIGAVVYVTTARARRKTRQG